jgi:DNA-binding NtrC family response regulator
MKEKKKDSYSERRKRQLMGYRSSLLRKQALAEQRIMKEKSLGTLLLVEDDQCLSEELKSFLEDSIKGWAVLTAKNLEEAKGFMGKLPYVDVVITDMSFPNGPGQTATEKSGLDMIKVAKDWHIDTIVYSSSENYLMSAKEAGAECMFNKNDMTKLCDAVKKRAEFIGIVFNRKEPKPGTI